MTKLLGISLVLVLLVGTVARAAPTHDTFWIDFIGDTPMGGGGGSGWNSGAWVKYDDASIAPDAWWNQWFYDDPPDPDRWKEITYDIDIDFGPLDPNATGIVTDIKIALNWSTVDYPETGPNGDPPSPTQEQYIGRQVIYLDQIYDPMAHVDVIGGYDILDFNPEWVSIDVMLFADQMIEYWDEGLQEFVFDIVPLEVYIIGDIRHECVPEPATLGLLLIGGLALLRRRRA